MNKYLRCGLYNGALFILSVLFIFLLVQHAMFFYTFPPDTSRYISVHPFIYQWLGASLFFILKAWHYIEEKAEVYGDMK